MRRTRSRAGFAALVFSLIILGRGARAADRPPAPLPCPVSAHNCYQANRADNPRLAEALALGIDNIEIDLGWDASSQRLTVGHDATPRPGLAYPEFEAMLVPALEAHWKAHPPGPEAPPTVLTVDWKTRAPEAVARFKAFLDRHADWFSSAPKADPSPLTLRRLTVCLTGSDAAKDAYDALIAPGDDYRAFRDTVTGAGARHHEDPGAHVPHPATAFHRFLTWHWGVVEKGGPFAAGEWTDADARRLESLIGLAHRAGYRVRVYCLNGQAGVPLDGYRFRSPEAARVRWRAAARAGVDWIASDDYAPIVAALASPSAPASAPTMTPIRRVADLDLGETARLTLPDGSTATVKLVGLDVTTDPVNDSVRGARVRLEVDGQAATIGTGNYQLPTTVGRAQVDCPVVAAYDRKTTVDHWALKKAARVRVWPAGSPWVEPGTLGHPLRQAWFASMTQMANEPVYVDAGEVPGARKVYYHSGLDQGGAEGLTEVVAATDGTVMSAGLKRLPEADSPVEPRYDVVYLVDGRGWYYRYSHLKSIDPAIVPGAKVKRGRTIGLLGKEGGSGGWSHLHFEIKARQPSGQWGTEEGYAYLWQAVLAERKPAILAVARPHQVARVGDVVRLDGARSWSRVGPVARFDWTFSDGTTATGSAVDRVYPSAGFYSEVLKATGRDGATAYDFAVVQVFDPSTPDRLPPTIHAAFFPTMGVKAGDPVTFKARTFLVGRDGGHETWDFGDGTPAVMVQSDGNAKEHAPDGYAECTHAFEKPGDYLARVERADRHGLKATARLWIRVGPR